MPELATLDWVFLAVLLCSVALGIWRGLVFELMSLAAWFVAFASAQWFGADIGHWLPMAGAGEAVRMAAGFVVAFVAALVAASLVATLAKRLVAAVGLSPVDRLMGSAFGLLRAALLLLAIAVVAGLTPVKTSTIWQESIGANLLGGLLRGLKPVLPAEYGKYLG
jgi:membrane protein required for colicin V production